MGRILRRHVPAMGEILLDLVRRVWGYAGTLAPTPELAVDEEELSRQRSGGGGTPLAVNPASTPKKR